MQTTLATLLFVTSAVVLACVVVECAVVTFEQTLEGEDVPQMDRIRELETMILNQTDNLFTGINSLNQTEIPTIEQALP